VRTTHEAVDLLHPGVFTPILVLSSPCVNDTEAMKFDHNPRFLVALPAAPAPSAASPSASVGLQGFPLPPLSP
jgi:hypothetical protein